MSKVVALSTAVTCGYLAKYYSSQNGTNFLSLLTLSILSILIPFWSWVLWDFFLYPLYFSPLLALSQAPRVRGWKDFLIPLNGDDLSRILDTVPNGGLLRYLDVLNKEVVVVTRPHAIAEFFQTRNDDYQKAPKLMRLLEAILGKGLISAEGLEHKNQRKALLPAFNFRAIKDLYPLFWSKSSEMVLLMKTQLEEATKTSSDQPSGVIDMDDWTGRVSLDIIGQAGFGSEFNALHNPHSALNNSYRKAFSPDGGNRTIFVLSLLTHPRLVEWLPLKKNRDIRHGVRAITNFIRDLIEERKREMYMNVDEVDYLEKTGQRDVITSVMKSGTLNTDGLVDQSKTFLGAGHETSGTALTWGTWLLSRPQNAHIQQRLREEIRANLPSPDSGIEVHSELLDRLPYLEAVSKEILRIRPPVPQVGRVAMRDTQLCGLKIPKGTMVRAQPWAINKSKHLWGEDAKEFNPERWMAGDKKANGGADNLAFLTFSHGPHGCIGKGFALAENKAVLAALMGSFRFEPLDGDTKEPGVAFAITARISGGLKVKATVLEGW